MRALIGFLMSLGLVGSVQALSIYDPELSRCDSYAVKAGSQFVTAQILKCSVQGLRWNNDIKGQSQWCAGVRPEITVSETKARANELLTCMKAPVAANEADLKLEPYQLGEATIRAIQADQLGRVQQLIAAGADVRFEGGWGNDGRMLYVAISNAADKTTRFLINWKHFSPNASSNAGPSPLGKLLQKRPVNYKLLEFLLQNGADPNYIGELTHVGYLPLVIAIQNKDEKAIHLLIKYKAKVNLDEGLIWEAGNILDIAMKSSTPKIVNLLKQAGAISKPGL